MACTHCDSCELYAQFALNPALQVWQVHYCQGDHSRCVRYQMSLKKEAIPLNMLPNGMKVEIPRSANDYSATALFNAILKTRVPMVESLLKNGIDVNVRNSDGITPLMAAASTGNIDVLRMLMARGADPFVVNGLGQSALDIAEHAGHTDAAAMIIKHAQTVKSAGNAKDKNEGGLFGRIIRAH
ncbi:MAG: ankyrin repeat domain-containing protein [Gammaproteobacteria bacterium]|nr:ankyrin repeat domain-containing protein [Gammaproteobacteria bacterium]